MLIYIASIHLGHGCWLSVRVGCFWEVYDVLESIRDIWFSCSQEVGCFLEGAVKRGFTVFYSVNIFTELEVN